MPFPLIAYAVGVATAGVVAYLASDDEEEKKETESKTKRKSNANYSSSDYNRREERRRKIVKFDKEVSEYIKKEKNRLSNKHDVNIACLIQKGQYRVELHNEKLFNKNVKSEVNRLKKEISEIDDTIIKLKEWRSKHV